MIFLLEEFCLYFVTIHCKEYNGYDLQSYARCQGDHSLHIFMYNLILIRLCTINILQNYKNSD